jgi:gluconokinase
MQIPKSAPNLIVMGVAGSGKSSVGKALAEALGATYLEGDAFHSVKNVALMSAGIALNDDNRAGWLAALAERLAHARATHERTVLACSALKRRYRDRLREGDPDIVFVYLAGSRELIAERMSQRQGHYMPVSLIDSQFRDLEPPQADERAIHCDISASLATIREQVLAQLPNF